MSKIEITNRQEDGGPIVILTSRLDAAGNPLPVAPTRRVLMRGEHAVLSLTPDTRVELALPDPDEEPVVLGVDLASGPDAAAVVPLAEPKKKP